ncbi:MAG: hypothetical protein INF91_01920 [Alphaproteobacteria bacterium]|nr:hypothetical protein [Alphaproteobacteria bacterium]
MIALAVLLTLVTQNPDVRRDYEWSAARQVAALLAHERGRYFYDGPAAQVAEAFGGPYPYEAARSETGLNGYPPGPIALGDNVLVWGCRPHSCPERAAVVLDKRKRVIGIAAIHWQCGRRSCARDIEGPPMLTLWLPPDSAETELALRRWGNSVSGAMPTETRRLPR